MYNYILLKFQPKGDRDERHEDVAFVSTTTVSSTLLPLVVEALDESSAGAYGFGVGGHSGGNRRSVLLGHVPLATSVDRGWVF